MSMPAPRPLVSSSVRKAPAGLLAAALLIFGGSLPAGCTAPAAKPGEKEAAPKQPAAPQTIVQPSQQKQPYTPPPPDAKLEPTTPTPEPTPPPPPDPELPPPVT